ncbi:hypothetical protein [Psychroserpens luteolus]|uniref:hypothetical protein n=1 Tax=Psychroserpens luteolus TaxID=2855840 RepID=UPI001E5BFC6C|nr:hypothetical protein [Psychroserpens luteolus]MCD2259838.1 hypothetical protein [Psychroserpens luteolus]
MSFFTKLKSALGNSKPSETKAVLDTIEAITNDIEHEPYAIAEQNVLYAGLNELGGYYFFQTVIVGNFHVKTKIGGQLIMIGENFELKLESDSVEFESDPTDVKGRSITKIDFQIEEEDAAKITNSKLNELVLTCKKHEITFSVINNKKKK